MIINYYKENTWIKTRQMDTNFTRYTLALLSKNIRNLIKQNRVLGATKVIDIALNNLSRIKKCSLHERNFYLSKLLGAKFNLFCDHDDLALKKLWDIIIETRRGELMLDERFACINKDIGVFKVLPQNVQNQIMIFVHDDVSRNFIN